jgi:triphosphatase
MEFFATPYETKTLQNYAASLTLLQDELGWRDDLAVADRFLRDLAASALDAVGGEAYVRGFFGVPMLRTWGPFASAAMPVSR